MFIDRQCNREEYPYKGVFYIKGGDDIPPDGDLFADSFEPDETVILETECDVTETSRTFSSGSITASYDVYFPAPDVIEVERGMLFRCNTFGLNVSGIVVSIGASKFGGGYTPPESTDSPESQSSSALSDPAALSDSSSLPQAPVPRASARGTKPRPGLHAYIKSFEI